MKKLALLCIAMAMFGVGEVVEQNSYTGEGVCVSSTCTESAISDLKPLYSETAESVCMNPRGCVERTPEAKDLTEYENPLTWGM
jgi:hypothetical protein